MLNAARSAQHSHLARAGVVSALDAVVAMLDAARGAHQSHPARARVISAPDAVVAILNAARGTQSAISLILSLAFPRGDLALCGAQQPAAPAHECGLPLVPRERADVTRRAHELLGFAGHEAAGDPKLGAPADSSTSFASTSSVVRPTIACTAARRSPVRCSTLLSGPLRGSDPLIIRVPRQLPPT